MRDPVNLGHYSTGVISTFGLYTGRALGAPWIGMAIGRVWYLAIVRAFRTNLLYFK